MRRALAVFAVLLAMPAFADRTRVLDNFENLAAWSVEHTDDTTAAVCAVDGRHGKALRLTFDFDHVNGYATAHRALPLDLPPNYELSFWVRGDAGVNNLQFKLIDASGENVWWRNQPDFAFPHEWQQIRMRKRQIEFAWGPTKDRELKHVAAIEFVVSSGRDGGKGEVDFSDLAMRALPAEENPPLPPTPNEVLRSAAWKAPRGAYPRGFLEQSYWTIVGVDGSGAPALMSEDGALEPRRGAWSIEPFLTVDGRTLTWADVTSTQTLADGYLPMPEVVWRAGGIELAVDAFARGTRASSQLVARYRVRNPGGAPADVTLELAIRPFQVNPPAQFLGSPGGVGHIRTLRWQGRSVRVDDDELLFSRPPDAISPRSTYDVPLPASSENSKNPAGNARDASGMASGAAMYRLHVPAHAQAEVDAVAPITGRLPEIGNVDAAWVARERAAVASAWRERLDRVALTVPPEGRRIADALRTAHADILLSRDGPALQPGTRSYARSWIRDGAMMADALLRLGDIDAVREYVDWYAPHQFSNGKVPCCVDRRGSDPVPENDSNGELIHAIAQLFRYDGDRAGLEKRWPHVAAAVAYMDKLRASETGAANPAFKGLMPASISHEGYSAKPEHSYWDDFWALTGYSDAAFVAQVLRKPDATRIARSRDEFRGDLLASINRAMQAHGIDFVPGCAELGDFDPTSSTVILSPAGELAALSEPLRREYERYWQQFERRASGAQDWKDYTPYEWRAVGSFVRLGWRERAQTAIDFFFSTGARPRGWNQWAEVVGRNPREIRFIGDMPHGWVASDFIRSALDLFAYERASDRALVLAAGIPARWFDRDGIAIGGLHTPYGRLGFAARRRGDRLTLHVDAGARPPGGFVFPWPLPGWPGATRINGTPASWQGGELRIPAAPAEVVIENARE